MTHDPDDTGNYIPICSIASAKRVAIQANRARDWPVLEVAIAYLEEFWSDDAAAKRFYTMLEQAAERD